MADWEQDSEILRTNLAQVARKARDSARDRESPTDELILAWHVEMMEGLEVGNAGWVGQFRGRSLAAGIEVEVAGLPGVHSADVARC